MTGWVKVGVARGGVLGTAVAAVAVGTWRWKQSIARAVERLGRSDAAVNTRVFAFGELEALPLPVVRYFGLALASGQRRIRRVRIEHAGEFRSGGVDGARSPFTDMQYFAADPPGFVWDAAIRMAPLLTVRVRDSRRER